MGILHEDLVLIRQAEKPEDPTVITVNCPDKTGLGCDLCRIILRFGLSICKGVKCSWLSVYFYLDFFHSILLNHAELLAIGIFYYR